MKVVAALALCIVLSGMLSPIYAQGICVPSPLKVTAVEGYVFWRSSTGSPMADVSVQLLSFEKNTTVAETKSGADGHFRISPPRAGKYLLRARDEQVGGLTVEIRFERRGALKDGAQEDIHFLLDIDPEKSCWGRSVLLVRHTDTGSKPAR